MERFRCTHASGGMHGGEHRRTVREEARQEYSKAAGNGAAAKMGSSSGGQAWMCNGAGDSSGDSWSAQSDGAAGRRSHSACWGRWIHRPRRGHRGAVGRREARRGWWELRRSNQTEGDELFGETTIACPTMNLVWRNDDRRGNATYDRRRTRGGMTKEKKVTPLFSKQR